MRWQRRQEGSRYPFPFKTWQPSRPSWSLCLVSSLLYLCLPGFLLALGSLLLPIEGPLPTLVGKVPRVLAFSSLSPGSLVALPLLFSRRGGPLKVSLLAYFIYLFHPLNRAPSRTRFLSIPLPYILSNLLTQSLNPPFWPILSPLSSYQGTFFPTSWKFLAY